MQIRTEPATLKIWRHLPQEGVFTNHFECFSYTTDTVTKPSVNLYFHRCLVTWTRQAAFLFPSGFVSTRLLFLSSPKLRASAHTVSTRELFYAVRTLTCSLRTKKSITKAARLQPDSVSPPSRQLPAMKSS